MRRIVAALVLAALAAPSAASAQSIGIYRSDDPGSVNTFWIRAPQGLIVIDSGRSLSDARKALAIIRRERRPVVAILVTHAHPDHVGGLGVIQDAFPAAPIYASAADRRIIETDPAGGFRQTREVLGDDYAAEIRRPNRIVRAGQTLRLGGLTIRTAMFGPGEAPSQTLYYVPGGRMLFAGDVVGDRVTPFLLDRRSCGWLQDLARLTRRFPRAGVLYPGHGHAGRTDELIGAQERYLRRFRRLVRRRIAPGGRDITAAERAAVVAAMERAHPGNLPVAGTVFDLLDRNVDAVAAELRSEPRRLPRPCRGS